MYKFDEQQLQSLWEDVFDAVAQHLKIPVDISNNGHVSVHALKFISRSMKNGYHNADLHEIYEKLSKKNRGEPSEMQNLANPETFFHVQALCRMVMEPAMIAVSEGNEFDMNAAIQSASNEYFGNDTTTALDHYDIGHEPF